MQKPYKSHCQSRKSVLELTYYNNINITIQTISHRHSSTRRLCFLFYSTYVNVFHRRIVSLNRPERILKENNTNNFVLADSRYASAKYKKNYSHIFSLCLSRHQKLGIERRKVAQKQWRGGICPTFLRPDGLRGF